MVLKAFNEAIDSKGLSPANEAIMRKLCSLYAMYWMVQRSGDFMTVSYLIGPLTCIDTMHTFCHNGVHCCDLTLYQPMTH